MAKAQFGKAKIAEAGCAKHKFVQAKFAEAK